MFLLFRTELKPVLLVGVEGLSTPTLLVLLQHIIKKYVTDKKGGKD
jgi:hypothetical protein